LSAGAAAAAAGAPLRDLRPASPSSAAAAASAAGGASAGIGGEVGEVGAADRGGELWSRQRVPAGLCARGRRALIGGAGGVERHEEEGMRAVGGAHTPSTRAFT
jgi:hypothetical protein